jgi:RNA polymerase sigma factor (TIGR02999 family)
MYSTFTPKFGPEGGLPMEAAQPAITQLLLESSRGDRSALDKLTPLVYRELRRIAHNQMRRERPGATLQATALVHEAYLKLINQREVSWQNRAHFFAIAAQEMRRILLVYARSSRTQKRGGSYARLTLDEALAVTEDHADDLIAIDEALSALEQLDPRQARIVELRFYVELSVEEIADVLGIGTATVKRDWAMARAWLLQQLQTKPTAAAASKS